MAITVTKMGRRMRLLPSVWDQAMPDGPIAQDSARRFHPLSYLFPPMEDKDFAGLVLDIRQNGLRTPIVTFGDMILDGRYRYRACKEAGVEPRYEEYAGADALDYVMSVNLHRRHLNQSQRAMIAAKLATMGHGGDRRSDQAAILPLGSQSAAASMLRVSTRLLRSAKVVLEHGAAELVIFFGAPSGGW